jgi:Flp pilus assembly pilin Flp
MSQIASRLAMGQGMVEFAIIIVLVGFTFIAGFALFGESIGDTFSTINSSLPPLTFGGLPVEINATETPTPTQTETPIFTPTVTETHEPTNTPADTPTLASTDTPTSTPTDTPTETPTIVPTATATNTPTSTPTVVPTPTTLPWYCVIWPQLCH